MGKSVHNEETRKLMEGILKLQSVDECYAFLKIYVRSMNYCR